MNKEGRSTAMARLIERSSFGTPAARSLRTRTPDAVAASINAELNRRSASNTRSDDSSRSGARNTEGRAIQALQEGGVQSARGSREEVIPMTGSRKTSAGAARAASKVLRDGRTSAASKTAAASALSQRAPKRGK